MKWNGRYLKFDTLKAGTTVTITFPVTQRYVKYRVAGAPWASKYSLVDEHSGSGMPLPKSIRETPPEIVKKILEPVEYTAHYLGNTIVEIEPAGTIYPLYQRKQILARKAPRRKVMRYIPETVISNWN